MKLALSDTRNSVDYFLRGVLSLSRRDYWEKGVELNQILSSLSSEDAKMVGQLIWRYRLESYLPHLAEMSFFDNVMHLLLLDTIRPFLPASYPRRVLDIGSKNFCYSLGIYEFLRSLQREQNPCSLPTFDIFGIELDVHRTYTNFFTRKACAKYFSSLVPHVHYVEGDVLKKDLTGPFDMIFHFFPFIELTSLLDFGLPARFFRPLELFRRAFSLLAPRGYFIMGNTTRNEYLRGKSLLTACQFLFIKGMEVDCGGFTPKPLYISVFTK
jgi:hypothetical protein